MRWGGGKIVGDIYMYGQVLNGKYISLVRQGLL